MGVSTCNQMERIRKLVGQNGAVDSLFLEACVSYKIYQSGKYRGIPEVVIYIYLLKCYWFIQW